MVHTSAFPSNTLGGLPKQVLTEIVSYLPPVDLLTLELTNKTGSRLVADTFSANARLIKYRFGIECKDRRAGQPGPDLDRDICPYVSRLNLITDPAEETRPKLWSSMQVAGGVYSFARGDDFLRLFDPGSHARAIEGCTWRIPAPNFCKYCFCPSGDVIAFFEILNSGERIDIQVRKMSSLSGTSPTGKPALIRYRPQDGNTTGKLCSIYSVLITESRIAMIILTDNFDRRLVVLSLSSGQTLHERKVERSTSMEFVDKYRLLLTHEKWLGLVMINTESYPMQATLFCFPKIFGQNFGYILMERSAHNQSIPEKKAAFHQDPKERVILYFAMVDPVPVIAFPVKALLGHEGADNAIQWESWNEHVVVLSGFGRSISTWISGCRVFSLWYDLGADSPGVRVYDLSLKGREGRIKQEEAFKELQLYYLEPAGVKKLPVALADCTVSGTRDSIVFLPNSGDTMTVWRF